MAQFYINFIQFTQEVFKGTGNVIGWFSTPLAQIGSISITPLALLTPIGLTWFIAIAIVRWVV